MRNNKKDYEVGYRKPPVQNRFQKGHPGNRAGRPKKKARLPSLEPAIVEAFSALVTVAENGEQRQISKYDAAFIQLANKAAGGHMASIKLLMPFFMKMAEAADSAAKAEAGPTDLRDARQN